MNDEEPRRHPCRRGSLRGGSTAAGTILPHVQRGPRSREPALLHPQAVRQDVRGGDRRPTRPRGIALRTDPRGRVQGGCGPASPAPDLRTGRVTHPATGAVTRRAAGCGRLPQATRGTRRWTSIRILMECLHRLLEGLCLHNIHKAVGLNSLVLLSMNNRFDYHKEIFV